MIAASTSMWWTELARTVGLHAQCGVAVQADNPAVCVPGSLAATLGADGKATKYLVTGDTKPAG